MQTSVKKVLSDDMEDECHKTPSVYSHASAPLSKIGLKAGMQGLDKAKVNQIILEATKGSKFHESELRKDEQISKRIASMMDKLEKVTDAQKATSLKIVDREIELLEITRDLSHIIIHVDMDAFYAAVEMRDNKKLKDVPMAVGSTGMLSTSNYLARQYGVRAAMPGFIGKKLCPELIIVEPNYQKYRQISTEIQDILAFYDPHFSCVGLDEAYLDLSAFVKNKLTSCACSGSKQATQQEEMTNNVSLGIGGNEDGIIEGHELTRLPLSYWKCAEVVVEEIRHEIYKKTGLTASAGIAPNKMLAKVASDVNKPDGQYLVHPTKEEVLKFVQKLPIRKTEPLRNAGCNRSPLFQPALWRGKIGGIGKVTERMLNALEIMTCADLYQKRAILRILFTPVSVQSFLCICLGIGSAEVYSSSERKSISTERTFSETSNPEELLRRCLDLCVSLSKDIQKKKVMGRTVTLKIKTVAFEVKSRACTLPRALSTADELYTIASELLKLEIQARSPGSLNLRLMGIRLSSLESSKSECKQSTLKDLFKQHADGGYPMESPKVPHSEECEDRCASADSDMAICPVCDKSVPSENTIFNKHIDECLNCSVIQDNILTLSTGHQHCIEENHDVLSQVSQKESLQEDKEQDILSKRSDSMYGSSSKSINYRKRKADSLPASCKARNKKRTLDTYFSKEKI